MLIHVYGQIVYKILRTGCMKKVVLQIILEWKRLFKRTGKPDSNIDQWIRSF